LPHLVFVLARTGFRYERITIFSAGFEEAMIVVAANRDFLRVDPEVAGFRNERTVCWPAPVAQSRPWRNS
jgi:hypothetical protein